MPTLVLNLALLIVVGLATVCDLRQRRIPNLLTFPAIGLGLALNAAFGGLDGLSQSAQGAGLGLALLFGLFLLRWMGAGDVKLMAAVGAIKGPEFVLFACLWAAVFGGAIALIGLLRARRFGLAMAHLYYSGLTPNNVGGSFMSGVWRMPYAPAIALGALLTLQGVRWIGH